MASINSLMSSSTSSTSSIYGNSNIISGLASGIMIGVVACVIDSRVPKQLFR